MANRLPPRRARGPGPEPAALGPVYRLLVPQLRAAGGESFVHPRVVGHARNFFVPVKIQSEQHEDLVERFGLTGIPATILIKPSGEVVARHEGYVDTATFGTFLERALIRSGRSPWPARSELTQTAASKVGRTGPAVADPKKAQGSGAETLRR